MPLSDPPTNCARLTVRCPTCGHLVEAPALVSSRGIHPMPLDTEMLYLHQICDLVKIGHELQDLAMQLTSTEAVPMFDGHSDY